MGGSRIDLLLFLNVPVLFSTITLLRQCCLDLSQGQDKSVSLADLEFLQPSPSAGLMFRAGCAHLPGKRRARPLTGLAYSLYLQSLRLECFAPKAVHGGRAAIMFSNFG